MVGSSLITSATSMINVYMGLHVYSLGGSLSDVALIYSSSLLATLLGRLPTGRVIDRGYPAGRLMYLGIALMSVSTAIITIIDDLVVITLANAVRGFGSGAFHVSFLSVTSSLPRKSASLVIVGPPLGMAIGPSIASAVFLISETHGIMLSSTLLYALSSPLIPRALSRYADASDDGEVGDSKKFWRSEVLFVLYNRAAVSYVIGTLYTIVPFYALSLGMSGEQVGLMFFVGALMNALIRPVIGRISLSTRVEVFMAQSILIISLIIITLRDPILPWIAMSLYGVGAGTFVSTAILSINELSPNKRRGSMTAMIALMMDVGNSLGSLFAPLIYDRYGPDFTFLMTASVIGSGALFSLILNRTSRVQ